jgi:hypothetical protein
MKHSWFGQPFTDSSFGTPLRTDFPRFAEEAFPGSVVVATYILFNNVIGA